MPYELDMAYGEAHEIKGYIAKFDKPIQSIALTYLTGVEMSGKPMATTPLYALGILHWVDVVSAGKPAEKLTEEGETKENP